MTIYTIGFTKKSAEAFFGLLQANAVRMLLDIRLNNSSQLAGFSKGGDLSYFLAALCDCAYKHESIFAPTKELMDSIKSHKITLKQYEADYLRLMGERNALRYFDEHYALSDHVCLLCSEDTIEQCHRRVLADALTQGRPDRTIKHL